MEFAFRAVRQISISFRNAAEGNIIFACLNNGMVKSLLEMSN